MIGVDFRIFNRLSVTIMVSATSGTIINYKLSVVKKVSAICIEWSLSAPALCS